MANTVTITRGVRRFDESPDVTRARPGVTFLLFDAALPCVVVKSSVAVRISSQCGPVNSSVQLQPGWLSATNNTKVRA